MQQLAMTYVATLVAFLFLDAIWLTAVAKPMYDDALGDLIRAKPDLLSAGLFYAVYCVGIIFFAIQPGVDGATWQSALWRGAFVGLLAYGTFAATNYAVLSPWTPALAIADAAWGCVVTGLSALAGYLAFQWQAS